MWRDIPTWFKLWAVFCLVAGIATLVYTFSHCGPKALLLGDGALYAAASGMCDE